MGIILFAMYVVTAVTVQSVTADIQGKTPTQANQEYHAQRGTTDYDHLN